MKAIEQFIRVLLFIMLYKVVLTFRFMDKTLVCDHSNSHWPTMSSTFKWHCYYAELGGPTF